MWSVTVEPWAIEESGRKLAINTVHINTDTYLLALHHDTGEITITVTPYYGLIMALITMNNSTLDDQYKFILGGQV